MHLAMDCGLTEKIFVLLQMQLGQTYIELSYCIKVVSAFCLKNDTYQIKRDFCNSSPTLTLTFQISSAFGKKYFGTMPSHNSAILIKTLNPQKVALSEQKSNMSH